MTEIEELKKLIEELKEKQSYVCPTCGRCPACGTPYYPVERYPYIPQYPPYVTITY